MKGMDSVVMYRNAENTKKDLNEHQFSWTLTFVYWLLIWSNWYEILVLMFLKMNDIVFLIYTSI